MPTVKDVIAAMNAIAPPALALEGDPIGLHSGNPGKKVAHIMLSLDASLWAVEAAVKKKADMLVVHHPRFYRGVATLADCDATGRRATAIARSGLAVFSAHTNLDLAEGGTNDVLAGLTGLVETELVTVEKSEALLKLAVFVPDSHVKAVLKALCKAGAGHIGKYADCTFRSRGTGTFRGGKDTNPFIGKPGILEEADEYRLETVFGEFAKERVLSAMFEAHPYEEVAYDLYRLEGEARAYGLGRVGMLPAPETLSAFARRLSRVFHSGMTQYHGKASRRIRRVAVWAGAGVNVKAVIASGAEVLVAGEVGYHDLETFADAGMTVVTLGHGYSEEMVLKPLGARLAKLLPECKIGISKTGLISMRNA